MFTREPSVNTPTICLFHDYVYFQFMGKTGKLKKSKVNVDERKWFEKVSIVPVPRRNVFSET
jgi:hypothetical protein